MRANVSTTEKLSIHALQREVSFYRTWAWSWMIAAIAIWLLWGLSNILGS